MRNAFAFRDTNQEDDFTEACQNSTWENCWFRRNSTGFLPFQNLNQNMDSSIFAALQALKSYKIAQENQYASYAAQASLKHIRRIGASVQVSPKASAKPLAKGSRRAISPDMFPPNRDRNESKHTVRYQRILPHNGKSSPALASPRVKTAPPGPYSASRTVASKNLLERTSGRNKIFEIHGVNAAHDVRKSLLLRGWIEKPTIKKSTTTIARSRVSLSALYEASKAEIEMELKDYFPRFIWTYARINWEHIREEQIVNQIPSPMFAFTSKVGLITCLQNSHWFQEFGKTNARCPRCYRLSITEERVAFGRRMHEDIDDSSHDAIHDDWEIFLEHFNRFVFGRGKLSTNSKKDLIEEAKIKYQFAKDALDMIVPYWPQLNLDGFHNIWICKPGEMSRGKGIVIFNNIENIFRLFPQKNKAWLNTVVQKYIERPLLIYNTKFDIRQWFLISRWNPLTVWFYKESYLRFCTKPFSIDDLHERVHLCNHSVQSKYNVWKSRSGYLPEDNIWDSNMFQEYLEKDGNGDIWNKAIYPGMKEGILGVLLASQDEFFSRNVIMRKNSFQLFGADFMICEDFTPWLIEINSNPDMTKDTKVLKRLCNSCIEDLMKVVIDRREDPKADTGNFEMLYQEQDQNIPLKVSLNSGKSCFDLCLRGARIRMPAGNLPNRSISRSKSKGILIPMSKSTRSVMHSRSTKSIDTKGGAKAEKSNTVSNAKSKGQLKNPGILKSGSRLSIRVEVTKHKRSHFKSKRKSKSKSPSVERSKSRKSVVDRVKSSKSKPLNSASIAQTQTSKTRIKRLPDQYRSKPRVPRTSTRPQGGQWKKRKGEDETVPKPKTRSGAEIKPIIEPDLKEESVTEPLVENEENNNVGNSLQSSKAFSEASNESPVEIKEEPVNY
ncbi:unnamed protein product [Allacma fusca]|uniref:Tubulin glycylase 3A n=1 Tax=Allacma fusca TaxID=39272 RepID=A0A8J2KN80_9HEXA|nr:unnamed protein product [Allacma fusca]